MLTKNVTVMLLIVLGEAALVVIFRVGVDVLYRRTIRTSGNLPVKSFSHKLLLYFAFFVKWVKSLTYLIFASQGLRSVLLIFTLGIVSLIFEVTLTVYM